MTTGITVPGTAGGNIVVTPGTGDYLKLASLMASALNNASTGGSLSVSTVSAGSFVPSAPTGKFSTTELGIVGSATGSSFVTGTPQWSYVVNLSPDTVVASNTQVLSGDQGATIYVSGTSSVAATGGNNYVNGTGNYVLSTSTGNDTIYAAGAGTVAAGAGTNFVSVSGSGNYVISAGDQDTIRQGSGPASVNVLGTNSSVTGSSNPADTLAVTLGGTSNIAYTGVTQATVSIGGSASSPASGNIVEGGPSAAGTLRVMDTGNFATISAGGDSVVSATVMGNSVQVSGGTGALNVSASGSNDTVAVGTGVSNVTLTGSAAYLFGFNNSVGGGTLTAFDSSNNSLITTQYETTSNITLTGSNSSVFGTQNASGTLNISIGGSNDTVYAGAGATTVTTSTNPVVFGPTNGTLQFVGGAGTPTVIGGTGGVVNATIGSGGAQLSPGVNGTGTITSGVGQVTIFGASGANLSFVGSASGGFQFHAYAGNETLNGGGSSAVENFFGSTISSANAVFGGGTNNDTFFVGSGSTTMTGGGGNDTFVVLRQVTSVSGSGSHVTITDFNTNDTLFIAGYSSANGGLSNVLANATGPGVSGTGSGITLTLSDNTTVTFTNLTSVSTLNGKIGYF